MGHGFRDAGDAKANRSAFAGRFTETADGRGEEANVPIPIAATHSPKHRVE